jgi:hypothetical protein
MHLPLLLTAALAFQELEIGQQVGQVFPDLELPTIQRDRSVRLSELRGRRLLLIEFASW